MSPRPWLALAALDGLMAVGAGAFGAHALSDPQVRDWLRTGAQYQLVHACAALACLTMVHAMPLQAALAGRLFALGALVFGGSLYLLALTGVTLLGAVTPLGGLMMIAGWAALLWGALTEMAAQ